MPLRATLAGMGRRVATVGAVRAGAGPAPAERLAGALAAEHTLRPAGTLLPAADGPGRDDRGPRRAGAAGGAVGGAVEDAQRGEDARHEGDDLLSATGWLPAAPGQADDERWPADGGRAEGARRAVRRTLRTAVPGEVRRGRWSVPWRAAVAAVVLAAVVAVLLAVRTAGAVPVETVPGRPTSAATSAPAPTGPGATSPGGTIPPGGTAPLVVAAPGASPPVATAPGAGATGAAQVVVHVVGQVAAPGLVRLPPGSRVADALDAAGGAAPEADLGLLNLARVVVDGEQVAVPRPGEVPAGTAAATAADGAGPQVGGGPAGPAPSGPAPPVNLNTADAAALDALPGIGEVLAGRILTWRLEQGRFTSVEELGEVSGIGDALMADLAPLVTV